MRTLPSDRLQLIEELLPPPIGVLLRTGLIGRGSGKETDWNHPADGGSDGRSLVRAATRNLAGEGDGHSNLRAFYRKRIFTGVGAPSSGPSNSSSARNVPFFSSSGSSASGFTDLP